MMGAGPKERRSGTTQIEFEYIKTTLSLSGDIIIYCDVCSVYSLYVF